MEEWKCDLVADFINDNKEIAFLYILKEQTGECEEMIQFIEEMKLTLKFLLYCDMRSQMGE